ncbi:hypothetical protein [Desulfoluna spongiiphila]|uniref:Uncharacterized protein n=1 Tax=Desulfoluna spongiiphila TaxID=419481 RepID=A0A1G5C7R8_9BACT|nr:hypothetical protein [Desulfoluna spongiiphila]SCX98368.1 hypothetical protein SAMN05216233_102431 [Desulfoluna spongiiphila]VVS94166.1 hypothetical protein DBB_37380 [Desulfoluna spongiiphila]
MTLLKKSCVRTLALLIFFFVSSTSGVAAESELLPLDSFNLTPEQMELIEDTIEEYIIKKHEMMTEIEAKFSELTTVLRQEEQVTTSRQEKKTARNVNRLVTDISKLYGKMIRTKVEYILKVKNVLTEDQRFRLVHSLEFEDHYSDRAFPSQVRLDDLIDLLGLTDKQVKEIIRNRTQMMVNELKIERDIQIKVIDLGAELINEEVNSDKVDKILLDITDLGTKLIDNKVKYKLKSKDVLTTPQKKQLLHMILLTRGSAS